MMQIVVEAKLVWVRKGKRIARKIRCTTGIKKGRVVSSASACSTRIDIKRRIRFTRLRAKMKTRFAMRAKYSKKFNPLSKRAARLNKAQRP